MKFTLRQLLIFVTIVAVVIWFALETYSHFTRVEFGENVHSVTWLPSTATNVSYYKSYSFTAYEFEISEADFLKWNRRKLSPIEKTVRVTRYCQFKTRVPDFGPNPTDEQLRAQFEVYQSHSAQVSDGLYYSVLYNNGGGVNVAYDRRAGKAYYFSCPR